MRRDRIVIEPYDPAWPYSFDEHRVAVEAALRQVLVGSVEHIGSTWVPGLPAKPIIDMLAVVEEYDAAASYVSSLESIGWVVAPEPGDEERRKWSLCAPSVEHRTHHLHVVEHASAGWRDWLLFRDYLRTHPDAADRYAALKRELAAADDTDRKRYRAGKEPLIEEIMTLAQECSEI